MDTFFSHSFCSCVKNLYVEKILLISLNKREEHHFRRDTLLTLTQNVFSVFSFCIITSS